MLFTSVIQIWAVREADEKGACAAPGVGVVVRGADAQPRTMELSPVSSLCCHCGCCQWVNVLTGWDTFLTEVKPGG